MVATAESEPLWDDAELVIYYSEVEENHDWDPEDGIPKWCQDTGLGSVSLWARMEDDGVEIPIYSMSPHGTWFSLNAAFYENANRVPVSEAFIDAVRDPWNTTEEQHEALTEAEKLVSNALRFSLFEGHPSPEAVDVIKWCSDRYNDGSDGD